MSKVSKLELQSIGEILEKDFFIPYYQRGYKWESRQVEDLLEDILEFSMKKERGELNRKEFYCLQPIVVKENKGTYEVIDGQQRLTTIYIILKYLEMARKFYDKSNKIYSIEYKTRVDSHQFLQNINTITEVNKENIDFYYMSNTFLTVKNWFDSQEVSEVDFLKIMLKNDITIEHDLKIDYANNIRVIWYEIKDENEIDVFQRLNIGKIPLTNAELIKALFLINIGIKNKKKKNESDKLILATEWDNIEYTLQEDKLFSFINSKDYEKATRIEFIFDLIADNTKISIENLRDDDDKKSYYIFDKLIKDEKLFLETFEIIDKNIEQYNTTSKRVEYLWDDAKRYFRIFDELYTGESYTKEKEKVHIYYHLVGFLINNGAKIQNIVDHFYKNNKTEFVTFLKDEIKKSINLKNRNLEDLNYEDDHKIIEKVLFLFNVILTMKSGYSKYPFDLHKSQKWSLEHIHAQNSKDIKKDEDREILLESEIEYIKDVNIKKEANHMLKEYQNNNQVSDDDFDNLQNKIFSEYKSSNKSLHTIDNLALLSVRDNSVLSNSVFPAKRDKIIELDKTNSFIPLGTKNVFLKYFSTNVKETLTWNDNDRKVYINEIEKEIGEYIK